MRVVQNAAVDRIDQTSSIPETSSTPLAIVCITANWFADGPDAPQPNIYRGKLRNCWSESRPCTNSGSSANWWRCRMICCGVTRRINIIESACRMSLDLLHVPARAWRQQKSALVLESLASTNCKGAGRPHGPGCNPPRTTDPEPQPPTQFRRRLRRPRARPAWHCSLA